MSTPTVAISQNTFSQRFVNAIKTWALWRKVGFYIILTVFAVIMFFPFYWLLVASLKSSTEINSSNISFWPTFHFENWGKILTNSRFIRYLTNSVIVAVCNVFAVTITSILAAFALAKLNIQGKAYIIGAMLILIAVPFEVLVITNYKTISDLEFHDSLVALVIPFVASVYYTILLRNSFLASSNKIYYAARIDGASNMRYLLRILIPQSWNTIVSIMLLSALASWNSIMWPLIVLRDPDNMTLTFLRYLFMYEGGISSDEMIMAASLISIIPTIVLYVFFRKYIVRSVNFGGTKG